MAGFGRRFAAAGYAVPKYRIEVHGRTLFTWSLLSLLDFIRSGVSFVFVARRAEAAKTFIRMQCDALAIRKLEVIELDEATDGQATTALMAGAAIADVSEPCFVYNIDTFVHPDSLPAKGVRGDGWIPCFPGAGSAWSFARADDAGRVSEVREKERISEHATVGLYWFSSFSLYRRIYTEYFSGHRGTEKGERYIAPMYNRLIQEGRPVFMHSVALDAVVPLGTPDDVERFRAAAPPIVLGAPHEDLP